MNSVSNTLFIIFLSQVKLDAKNHKGNYTCLATYENEQQKQIFVFEERSDENAAISSLGSSSSFVMLSIAFTLFV